MTILESICMNEKDQLEALIKNQAIRLGISEDTIRSNLRKKPFWVEPAEAEAQNKGVSLERYLVEKCLRRKEDFPRSRS